MPAGSADGCTAEPSPFNNDSSGSVFTEVPQSMNKMAVVRASPLLRAYQLNGLLRGNFISGIDTYKNPLIPRVIALQAVLMWTAGATFALKPSLEKVPIAASKQGVSTSILM
jgi:hypothetical protein